MPFSLIGAQEAKIVKKELLADVMMNNEPDPCLGGVVVFLLVNRRGKA